MKRSLFRVLAGAALVCSCALAGLAEEPAPSVEKLTQKLASKERDVRREAAYQLGRLGPAAKPALSALLTALHDEDKQVWAFALSAIAALGPDATDAIPALIEELNSKRARGQRDPRQGVIRYAHALTCIGPAAVPPLIEALGADDIGLRMGATLALGSMGKEARAAVPALIKNLTAREDFARDETVAALGKMGPDAAPPLLVALNDSDPLRRAGALLALALLDAPVGEAASQVEQLVAKETDPLVRSAALTALPKLGMEPQRCVKILLPAITSEDEALRHAGINALLSTRALRKAALPPLSELLKDANPAIRERAARVLGRMGPDAAGALPALLEATRAAGGATAFSEALAQVGPAALPLLLEALQKGNAEESAWILSALRGFGPPAVSVLSEALKQPNPVTRAAAAGALGGMGRDAIAAVNPLFVLAGEADPSVQAAALRALVALHADSDHLKPLLQTALANPNADVRKAAAAGLAALGGAAALGVNGLLDLLAGDDAAGRLAAVEALGQLGAQSAPAVEVLASRLADSALQSAIIETLGRIGPASASAVPRLLDVAQKKGSDQRTSVLPALARIGPGATAALPMIYAAIRDEATDVRASASTALASVESDDAKAIAALVPLVTEGESGKVHRATAVALVKYGERASAAVPGLVRMLDRETDRGSAMQALKAIGVRTVPDLVKMLAVKEPRIRTFACESLGALGPAAKDAVPKLQELLAGDSSLRAPVTAALAKIEAPKP